MATITITVINIDIIISVLIIAGTLLLSKFLRNYLSVTLSRDGLFLGLCLEFIAMFEACAVTFERSLIAVHHGMFGYTILLFFACLWRAYHWSNLSTVPYTFFVSWIDGAISVWNMFAFIGAEVAAGSIVYNYYTKIIWSQGWSHYHTEQLAALAHLPCKTSVHVHYLYAAAIECLITFILTILGKYIAVLILRKTISFGSGAILKSSLITLLVLAAYHTTGGYMSPVLASTIEYGCTGITLFQHVFVFWIGASIGFILAVYTWNGYNNTPSSGSPPRSPPRTPPRSPKRTRSSPRVHFE